MISSRDQRRIFLLPGKTRSVSESRLHDISTAIKQVQQNRPMRRHPDRSCTYLGLRATPDEHYVRQPTIPQVAPGWHRKWLWFGPALRRKHWPGGAKIKMTLERATPKGKRVGGEANGKGNVGPCWKSLIQSELSRGSHKSPDRVRDAKSGNITPI